MCQPVVSLLLFVITTCVCNNILYQTFSDPKPWNESELHCQMIGGHLASIHDIETNNKVYDLFVAQNPAAQWGWIGLNITNKYYPTWSDGTNYHSIFRHGMTHYPESYQSDNICGAMDLSNSNRWARFLCSRKYPFICGITNGTAYLSNPHTTLFVTTINILMCPNGTNEIVQSDKYDPNTNGQLQRSTRNYSTIQECADACELSTDCVSFKYEVFDSYAYETCTLYDNIPNHISKPNEIMCTIEFEHELYIVDYVSIWGFSWLYVVITFFSFCLLYIQSNIWFFKFWTKYKGVDCKAVVESKTGSEKFDRCLHIKYVTKYVDENENEHYSLYRKEKSVGKYIYERYKINECIDIKYCISKSIDSKNQMFEYHKHYHFKEELDSIMRDECCMICILVFALGWLIFWYWDFFQIISSISNNNNVGLVGILFVFVNSLMIVICPQFICTAFAGFLDDPFQIKGTATDKFITKEEYNQFMRQLNQRESIGEGVTLEMATQEIEGECAPLKHCNE